MIEQINNMAHLWWGWTSAMFWQAGLLIALIALLDRLIRRWAWPQLRYALWSLILIKLVLSPALSSPGSLAPRLRPLVSRTLETTVSRPAVKKELPPRFAYLEVEVNRFAARPESRALVSVPDVTVPRDLAAGDVPIRIAGPRLDWRSYAMFVWFAGMMTLGAWLMVKLRRLGREYPDESGRASLPQSFHNQLAGCAKRLGLRRIPIPIVTNSIRTPAVFGLFRPIMLMPVGYIRNLSRKDTEYLLLHELAHIKRGDLITHSLYMLLQLVYWYNPLLWLVRRRLRHLRELCCDATVATLLRERTVEYRRTLLEAARQFLITPVECGLGLVGLFEDSNFLIARIKWLEKPVWRYRKMKNATVIAMVLFLLVCVLPMAQAQEGSVLEPPSTGGAEPSEESPAEAVETAEAEVAEVAEAERAQSQKLEQLLKAMQALQVQLQQLEQQKQKLQHEIQAMSHAEHLASDHAHQAKAHAAHAEVKAKDAKDKAAKASVKAKEAKSKSEKAKAKAQAEHWQQWAKQMEKRAQGYEKWAESGEFKKWQEDMQKWAKEMAQSHAKTGGAGAGPAPTPRPMPVMPPMPPMPVEVVVPVAPILPTAVVPTTEMPAEVVGPTPALPGEVTPSSESGRVIEVRKDKNDMYVATTEMHFVSKVRPGVPFVIRSNMGRIVLRPSKDGKSDVRAVIRGKAKTGDEARAKVEQVGMNIDASNERYYLKPIRRDGGKWDNLNVDLHITVPPGVVPDVQTNMGSVELYDLEGKIKVVSNMGAIKAVNTSGDVELFTKMGSIEFVAPKDLSARLSAQTKMGSIKSDLPLEINQPDMFRKGAQGTVGDGQGNIRLTTNMGSISLKWHSPVQDKIRVLVD